MAPVPGVLVDTVVALDPQQAAGGTLMTISSSAIVTGKEPIAPYEPELHHVDGQTIVYGNDLDDFQVFAGPVAREQVAQRGELGDCVLISVLRAVAGTMPQVISQVLPAEGTGSVILHTVEVQGDRVVPTGSVHRVPFPSRLPVLAGAGSGSPYARSMQASWGIVLEHVMARLDQHWTPKERAEYQQLWHTLVRDTAAGRGQLPPAPYTAAPIGYPRLDGASAWIQAVYLAMLTGQPVRISTFDASTSAVDLAEHLRGILMAGSPVLVSTTDQESIEQALGHVPDDLHTDHAYELLLDADGGFVLDNPHGIGHVTLDSPDDLVARLRARYVHLDLDGIPTGAGTTHATGDDGTPTISSAPDGHSLTGDDSTTPPGYRRPTFGELFDALDADPGRTAEIQQAILTELAGRDFGPLTVTASSVGVTPSLLNIQLDIVDRGTGEVVGFLQRKIHRLVDGTLYAEHCQFGIDQAHRGTGFYGTFGANMETWYVESGVQHIEALAGSDIGGHAMARQDYTWHPDTGPAGAMVCLEKLDLLCQTATAAVAEIRRALDGQPNESQLEFAQLLAESYGYETPQSAVDGMEGQIREALDIRSRADRHPFGGQGFPSALEVASCGEQWAGPFGTWLGKTAMLGASWFAYKVPQPHPQVLRLHVRSLLPVLPTGSVLVDLLTEQHAGPAGPALSDHDHAHLAELALNARRWRSLINASSSDVAAQAWELTQIVARCQALVRHLGLDATNPAADGRRERIRTEDAAPGIGSDLLAVLDGSLEVSTLEQALLSQVRQLVDTLAVNPHDPAATRVAWATAVAGIIDGLVDPVAATSLAVGFLASLGQAGIAALATTHPDLYGQLADPVAGDYRLVGMLPDAGGDPPDYRRPPLGDLIVDSAGDAISPQVFGRIATAVAMELAGRDYGELGVRTTEVRLRARSTIIGLDIVHPGWNQRVGSIQLELRRQDGDLAVTVKMFEITSVRHRGTPLFQRFNDNLKNWCHESGIPTITLAAALASGGYVWPYRRGFTWLPTASGEGYARICLRRLADECSYSHEVLTQINSAVTGHDPAQLAEAWEVAEALGYRPGASLTAVALDLLFQIRAADEVLVRAKIHPFGHPLFPNAPEIAQAGYGPGQQTSRPHIGKRAMLGSTFRAAKTVEICPEVPRRSPHPGQSPDGTGTPNIDDLIATTDDEADDPEVQDRITRALTEALARHVHGPLRVRLTRVRLASSITEARFTVLNTDGDLHPGCDVGDFILRLLRGSDGDGTTVEISALSLDDSGGHVNPAHQPFLRGLVAVLETRCLEWGATRLAANVDLVGFAAVWAELGFGWAPTGEGGATAQECLSHLERQRDLWQMLCDRIRTTTVYDQFGDDYYFAITHGLPGLDPQRDAVVLQGEIDQATALLEQAESHPFGAPGHPTPHDVFSCGHSEAPPGADLWLGSTVIVPSVPFTWAAVKDTTSMTAIDLDALPSWNPDLITADPAGYQPPNLGDLIPTDAEECHTRRDEIVAALQRELAGRDYGPLHVSVAGIDLKPGVLAVRLDVFRLRDGQVVGSTTQRFVREDDGGIDQETVRFLIYHVPDRGTPLFRLFNDNLENWCWRSGVRELSLEAGLEAGGVVWPARGYDWLDAGEHHAKSCLQELAAARHAMDRAVEAINQALSVGDLDGAQQVAAEYGYQAGTDPARAVTGMLQQIAEADAVLHRAATVPFGSPTFPTPYEITQVGRQHAGRSWLGQCLAGAPSFLLSKVPQQHPEVPRRNPAIDPGSGPAITAVAHPGADLFVPEPIGDAVATAARRRLSDICQSVLSHWMVKPVPFGDGRFEIRTHQGPAFRIIFDADDLANAHAPGQHRIIARTTRGSDGTYHITLDSCLTLGAVPSAVAHELVELLTLCSRRLGYSPAPTGADHAGQDLLTSQTSVAADAQLSAHDLGGLAQLTVIAHQWVGFHQPAARQEAARQVWELAQLLVTAVTLARHLGLDATNPAAAQRLARVRAEGTVPQHTLALLGLLDGSLPPTGLEAALLGPIDELALVLAANPNGPATASPAWATAIVRIAGQLTDDATRANLAVGFLAGLGQDGLAEFATIHPARYTQLTGLAAGDYRLVGLLPGTGVAAGGTGRPSLRDLVVTTDHDADDSQTQARIALAIAEEFTGRDYGPLRVRTAEIHVVPGTTIIGLDIVRPGWRQPVGTFRLRLLNRQGDATVSITMVELNSSIHRGTGFLRRFHDNLENWCHESGISQITLLASMDLGGLVWALMGYTWDAAQAGEMSARQCLQRLVAERARYLRGIDDLNAAIGSGRHAEAQRIAATFGYPPGADPRAVIVGLLRQVRDATGLLLRGRHPFGGPVFPTAPEFALCGHPDGQSPVPSTRIGQQTMLGSTWLAAKEVEQHPEVPRRNPAIDPEPQNPITAVAIPGTRSAVVDTEASAQAELDDDADDDETSAQAVRDAAQASMTTQLTRILDGHVHSITAIDTHRYEITPVRGRAFTTTITASYRTGIDASRGERVVAHTIPTGPDHYAITLSAGLDPSQVSAKLAHELVEIITLRGLALPRRLTSGLRELLPPPLRDHAAHRQGLAAELAVLADDLARHPAGGWVWTRALFEAAATAAHLGILGHTDPAALAHRQQLGVFAAPLTDLLAILDATPDLVLAIPPAARTLTDLHVAWAKAIAHTTPAEARGTVIGEFLADLTPQELSDLAQAAPELVVELAAGLPGGQHPAIVTPLDELHDLAVEYDDADVLAPEGRATRLRIRLRLASDLTRHAEHTTLPTADLILGTLPADVRAFLDRLAVSTITAHDIRTQIDLATRLAGADAGFTPRELRARDIAANLTADVLPLTGRALTVKLHELAVDGEARVTGRPARPGLAGTIVRLDPSALEALAAIDTDLASQVGRNGLYVDLHNQIDLRSYDMAHLVRAGVERICEVSLGAVPDTYDLSDQPDQWQLLLDDRRRALGTLAALYGEDLLAQLLPTHSLQYVGNGRTMALVDTSLVDTIVAALADGQRPDIPTWPSNGFPAGSDVIELFADRPDLVDVEGRSVTFASPVHLPLGADTAKPDDVLQGELGDCGFISMMRSIARHRPDLIRDIVRTNDTGEYPYAIHLHQSITDGSGHGSIPTGRTVKIHLTDLLPVDHSTGEFVYAKPDLATWPAYLEKALAAQSPAWTLPEQIDGQKYWLFTQRWDINAPVGAVPDGYETIVSSDQGQRAMMLTRLTGLPAQVSWIELGDSFDDPAEVEEHWARLLKARSPVLIGTRSMWFDEDPPPDLFPMHAYEVVAVRDGQVWLSDPQLRPLLGPIPLAKLLPVLDDQYVHLAETVGAAPPPGEDTPP
ncbi:MAG: hypothetical protein KJO75_21780 [Dactylosporangium sp.]|nr:hypothetical protein [Dactylosporangium sp.]